MAFKTGGGGHSVPDSPRSLLRDLRKKTIKGLLDHQGELINSYLEKENFEKPDVALQLPTGSGKTLVGLLIGEWRRRRFGERVVYLCPTNQLVNQVAGHATLKYGMTVRSFTGKKVDFDAAACDDWTNRDAIAITSYSSLFNVNPFFADSDVIICDDAHSAENYISSFWSTSVTSNKYPSIFSALLGLLLPLLADADKIHLSAKTSEGDDARWVDKIPTPRLQPILPELVALLDEHTRQTDLRYSWSILRHCLSACHVYISKRSILIRPLIPPSNTHAPFANATQRIYMSATLGVGGDLERITGRYPITRIPIPSGWDQQGIGRRFFIFPRRATDKEDLDTFIVDSAKLAGRSLYLTPDDPTTEAVRELFESVDGHRIFSATDIEESTGEFVKTPNAIAIVANRYDGIDLAEDECRLLFMDGLPRGANLQERFLQRRVGASLLLDDRVLTRVVQGFGRCTRSFNDYAAVVVLGETLHRYLMAPEHREFFHPEIQAELQFGLNQSKDTSTTDMLENIGHFLDQDDTWDNAHGDIVDLRATMSKRELPGASELAEAVPSEIKYQYAMWSGDAAAALEHCRSVIGVLKHPRLKGYRALWLYLAGSAASLATDNGELNGRDIARRYFSQAQKAALSLRWLVGLRRLDGGGPIQPGGDDDKVFALIDRIETVLDDMGTVHDGKYDEEENAILRSILQDEDGTLFEEGQRRLGKLLGFNSGNSSERAAPDPWWIVDDDCCFVFEDHAEAKNSSVLGATKARQVASHPNWLRENLELPEAMDIIPILVTPVKKADAGAFPHLKNVRYWNREDFREWAKAALRAVRDIRKTYPGSGDIEWRTDAAKIFKVANIGPEELKALLSTSAYDALEEDGSDAE